MSRTETKKRIPHMLLDTDFFDKPENVEAVDKFGDLAPAAILRLCLKLMNETKPMKKSQVLAMWRATGTDQQTWNEIIEYYISCDWLVEQNDCISSARTEKERARVEQKRSILSANAKQKHSKSEANKEQSASISSDTDTDTDTDTVNIKENSQPFTLPPKLECPEVRAAVEIWFKKLKTQGRNLDQLTLDAQLMGLALDKKRILDAINYSCSLTKCWNLIEKPDKTPTQYQKQDPPRARIPEFKPPEREKVDPNSPEVLAAKAKIKALTGVSV